MDYTEIIKEINRLAEQKHPHQVAGNSVCLVVSLVLAAGLAKRGFETRASRWALLLPLGYLHYSIGFIFRLLARRWPSSPFVNAAGFILIYASPYSIPAVNFLIYPHLYAIASPNPQQRLKFLTRDRFAPIPPRLVVLVMTVISIFIMIFYTTVSGLTSLRNLAPFAYQLFLYTSCIAAGANGIYLFILAYTRYTMAHEHKRLNPLSMAQKPVDSVFRVVWATSILSFVRLGFHIRAGVEGGLGKLWTDEVWLFCLDAIPTFLAGIIFFLYWPPSLLNRARQQSRQSDHSVLMETV